jgi:NAD-dependent dihydropyrimidine dehydrogenase PreA subunit
MTSSFFVSKLLHFLPERADCPDERAPPGENCLAERGRYVPVIDRNRCEGKGACKRVCPHDVFEVKTIESEDYERLTLLGRVRSTVHGKKSAYTPNASQCQACGLCVVACPEKAVTLATL